MLEQGSLARQSPKETVNNGSLSTRANSEVTTPATLTLNLPEPQNITYWHRYEYFVSTDPSEHAGHRIEVQTRFGVAAYTNSAEAALILDADSPACATCRTLEHAVLKAWKRQDRVDGIITSTGIGCAETGQFEGIPLTLCGPEPEEEFGFLNLSLIHI